MVKCLLKTGLQRGFHEANKPLSLKSYLTGQR